MDIKLPRTIFFSITFNSQRDESTHVWIYSLFERRRRRSFLMKWQQTQQEIQFQHKKFYFLRTKAHTFAHFQRRQIKLMISLHLMPFCPLNQMMNPSPTVCSILSVVLLFPFCSVFFFLLFFHPFFFWFFVLFVQGLAWR